MAQHQSARGSPCLVSSDDVEVALLSNVFERSLENALDRISSLADHSVDCAVATPVIEGAQEADVVAGICRVWTELRRVLRPAGATLLVVDGQRSRGGSKAEMAWRTVFSLQKANWTLRNALIGPVYPDLSATAVGYFIVARPRYFFDVGAVRARYETNPGDVVLPGADSIIDRFLAAARPRGGLVVDLFGADASRRGVA